MWLYLLVVKEKYVVFFLIDDISIYSSWEEKHDIMYNNIVQ